MKEIAASFQHVLVQVVLITSISGVIKGAQA
jgi:hypothetical protein